MEQCGVGGSPLSASDRRRPRPASPSTVPPTAATPLDTEVAALGLVFLGRYGTGQAGAAEDVVSVALAQAAETLEAAEGLVGLAAQAVDTSSPRGVTEWQPEKEANERVTCYTPTTGLSVVVACMSCVPVPVSPKN